MKTYAFIFARGGSKGLLHKNILPLAGKPLIAYSIEVARQVAKIDDVFVSTEDHQIAQIGRKYGATIIQRPEELAGDTSPEWAAWQHAIEWMEENNKPFDVFISLPATSPLRIADDVKACLDRLDDETDMVVTITDATRSPWFNMVKKTRDGFVRMLIESKDHFIQRQDVPKAFDMTTVAYVARPEFTRSAANMFEGRVKAVRLPQERAIDIDTKFDFDVAELFMEKRLSGKKG